MSLVVKLRYCNLYNDISYERTMLNDEPNVSICTDVAIGYRSNLVQQHKDAAGASEHMWRRTGGPELGPRFWIRLWSLLPGNGHTRVDPGHPVCPSVCWRRRAGVCGCRDLCLTVTAGFTGLLLLSQVPDLVVHEEEVYDDEDDENDEANWRNDYPDEESDADEDREERYGGEFVFSSSDRHYFVRNVTKEECFRRRLLGGGALLQPGELAALPEGAVAWAQLPWRWRRRRMPIWFRLIFTMSPANSFIDTT